MDLGPFPVGRTCSHHARNNCLSIPVQAVPLQMKWGCMCDGRNYVLYSRQGVSQCDVMQRYVKSCDVMCCVSNVW